MSNVPTSCTKALLKSQLAYKDSSLLSWLPSNEEILECHSNDQKLIVLQSGEGIFCKQSAYKKLFQRRIFGKLIGVNSSSKNISQFVSQPYLIDKFSCTYAVKQKLIEIDERFSHHEGIKTLDRLQKSDQFKIFSYFVRMHKFFLLDGHKFGCNFLVYEKDPENEHAKFLLFINPSKNTSKQISRLIGICKKSSIIAGVRKKKIKKGQDVEQVQQIYYGIKNDELEYRRNRVNIEQESLPSNIELQTFKKMMGFIV